MALDKVTLSAALVAAFILIACTKEQVDENVGKAARATEELWDKSKPDNLLFKGIVIGESTYDDVVKQAGKPDTTLELGDHSLRLEYPRAPGGTSTWVVAIDGEGHVRAIDQVLTAQNIARIHPGMLEAEVREILARPSESSKYALKNETVWSWYWQEQPTQPAYFDVHFGADGRVSSTSRRDDPKTMH